MTIYLCPGSDKKMWNLYQVLIIHDKSRKIQLLLNANKLSCASNPNSFWAVEIFFWLNKYVFWWCFGAIFVFFYYICPLSINVRCFQRHLFLFSTFSKDFCWSNFTTRVTWSFKNLWKRLKIEINGVENNNG